MIHEYAFDVTFAGALRIKAASEAEARATLADCLDCIDANLGAWPSGDPILAEVSMNGEPVLYEVDGETVP